MEHKYMRKWNLDPIYYPKLRQGMALQPWQTLGVLFLHFHRHRTGFACLGDEMGVGKVVPRHA
jgi:hypothetical protein